MEADSLIISILGYVNNVLQQNNFSVRQNGRKLKFVANNKDIYYEIVFQKLRTSTLKSFDIIVHVAIYSKSLKKWNQKNNLKNKGLIYVSQLGYCTPFKSWKTWTFNQLNFVKSIEDLVYHLKTYILPIFLLFENKANAVLFIAKSGTKFNPYCENTLFAVDFMLQNATKEQIEDYFRQFMSGCSWSGTVKRYLQTKGNLNDGENSEPSFIHKEKIDLLIENGIKVL